MNAARWPLRVALALAALGVAPGAAEARRVLGAELPDPADPVNGQPHHFVLRKPWNKVMQDLRRSYGRVPGVVIRLIDTPPSVKAYFIENTRKGRTWDGLNVYQNLRDNTVYVTVLPARRAGRARLTPAESLDETTARVAASSWSTLDVRPELGAGVSESTP